MEFDKAVAELDALVATLEREGDERALVLLELIDAIHRPALRLLSEGRDDHPIVRALLAMYDLAPADELTQVEEALDRVRPYIESHGGVLELLEVRDGEVHLRLGGACHGCAASAMTLRRGIETALREGYGGFERLVAHEAAPPDRQLLQIEGLRRPVFADALPIEELEEGGMTAVEVEGASVLLLKVDGEAYAFRNGCPVDGLPLDGGRLADRALVCPWHNCAFDARTGRRLDGEEAGGLAVVPVAMRDGSVQVAVNVA